MKNLNMVILILMHFCSNCCASTRSGTCCIKLQSANEINVKLFSTVYCRKVLTKTIRRLVTKESLLQKKVPGRVAQSIMCLATDACLTADPGVVSSIPGWHHPLVEIDHEIISTVILLPSADLFKKGCCQLQAKVCAQITG